MPGRMEFEFSLKPKSAARRSSSDPMRILLLGNFSGSRHQLSHSSPDEALASRRIHRLDIDTFDRVLETINPQLQLADGEILSVSDIDDFHPDSIYSKISLFGKLRDLRKRLQNTSTAAAALAELRAPEPQTGTAADGGPDTGAASDADKPATENDMFSRLLGQAAPANPQARQPAEAESINRFIRSVVAEHVVDTDHAETQQYIDGLDSSISEQMGAILHGGDFQSLEAAWRSAFWLISNLETDEELQLFLLDLSKEELAEDLSANAASLTDSALYRRLVEQGVGTAGGEPWSVIIGNYFFGANEADVSCLNALGVLASHSGGPFLAGAQPSVLGCNSLLMDPEPANWQQDQDFSGYWKALRQSEAAPWLGLALPRLLLRLPYGPKTDPVDRFDFDETGSGRQHDHYLWGNPAFACALLIGRAFRANGWASAPGDELDIDDLPAHSYMDQGESSMQACAELFLSERHADAIMAFGLMPVISYRNANQVRIASIRSIADPPSALAGAWHA